MALIKCPGCKNEVSENAVACPKCGEPIKGEIRISNAKMVRGTEHTEAFAAFKMTMDTETQKLINQTTERLNSQGKSVINVTVGPIKSRMAGMTWSNSVTIVWEANEDDPIFKSWKAAQVSDTPSSSQGCYIATAVYGNYNSTQVNILRCYRDTVLQKKWYGRIFIRYYYVVSPWLVKRYGNKATFLFFFRGILDKFISMVKE